MNNHFNISLYFLKGAVFTQIGTINGHWLVKVLTHPTSPYELNNIYNQKTYVWMEIKETRLFIYKRLFF